MPPLLLLLGLVPPLLVLMLLQMILLPKSCAPMLHISRLNAFSTEDSMQIGSITTRGITCRVK